MTRRLSYETFILVRRQPGGNSEHASAALSCRLISAIIWLNASRSEVREFIAIRHRAVDNAITQKLRFNFIKANKYSGLFN